jgi:predicted DCC family thiol-disulfide oxidoreductase YuxK
MTPAPVETPAPPQADPFPGRAVVLYDGDCPFCQRSIALLKRLDWFKKLAYHSARDVAGIPPAEVPLDPAKLLEEMHLLTPDRRHAPAGYAAFRWIAWRLPLTLPIAPLLYVPGVAWLGNRVYRWVAKNRFGLSTCHDGACQVPLKRS